MRIIQVAAEFAPIAKAGGLGEVLLGLSRELTSQRHAVDVFIPKYSFIPQEALRNLRIEQADFRSLEKEQSISNTLWSATAENCQLRLLEARHPAGYFHRDRIYGYPDDTARFLYFSRAVIEYLKLKREPIDILHLHDWHTAACAVFARDILSSSLKVGAIVLTIHNLEYQGKCASWDLDAIGLTNPFYRDRMYDEQSKAFNLLKGGISYANAVNTVSPSYATEILTVDKGLGLNETLKNASLFGILNGIDTKLWNPAIDPYLAARYSSENSAIQIRNAKLANKELIGRLFKIDCSNRPLVGVISRLVPQKGIHLLHQAIEETLRAKGAFALLGSSPIPAIQQEFDRLKESYQGHPCVFLHYEYSDELAHQLFAAFDFILIPSLFEPCGLTQLIALRYGAIPIVRSTGGLKDTIFDHEDGLVSLEKRNGFVFKEATSQALHAALRRALSLFHSDPIACQSMVRRATRCDSSWKKPAEQYMKFYENLLKRGPSEAC